MIVYTWEDLVDIIRDIKNEGKKIGWVASEGNLHSGHKSLVPILRQHCDYTVCSNPPITRGENYSEYDASRLWGITTNRGPIKTTSEESFNELNQLYDLVLAGYTPFPPPELDNELKEVGDKYIEFFRQYDPLFFVNESRKFGDMAGLAIFVLWYYKNKYWFQTDVRITSWKEGLRRLVDKKAYEYFLNMEILLAQPIRDSNGLCISTSIRGLDEKEKNKLVKFLNMKPLITNIDETKESLQERLIAINWNVKRFEKYEGELLDWYGRPATYFYVLLNPNSNVYQEYIDAFIIDQK